ncbi:MAG: deoxyribonuclease IV [Bacilli bacterium]|nr:deoxyribonuclease IV [Bacilli bacterium]
MLLGSHVSNNGVKMLLGSVEEAISYGANCFMIYTGAPQNTFRKNVNQMNIDKMHAALKEANISLEHIIVHCPYIVNLAQQDTEKFSFAVDFLTKEVIMTTAIGAKIMVLHPGAHVGSGSEAGVKRIAEGINYIIQNTYDSDVIIAIETMAGKGTECGRTFQEIKAIIDMVEDKSRIGVCLDTCHINDAGYDLVNNYDGVFKEFDDVIGFDYLKVIHVNDSKNPLSSHKDRHENIGFGTIGFETLSKVIYDERFASIPKILETPYVTSPISKDLVYPPYKHEIAMIKAKTFDENLKELIVFDYEN